MPIVSAVNGLWADALDPIVRKWFDLGFNRRTPLLPELFNVQGSTRAYEEISGIGAIGIGLLVQGSFGGTSDPLDRRVRQAVVEGSFDLLLNGLANIHAYRRALFLYLQNAAHFDR